MIKDSMDKVYFNNIRTEIIPLLQQAKSQVRIAMAWFTSSELFQTLLECLQRKVSVELLLLDDPINFMDYAPDFNEFIGKGGVLHIVGREYGFMHHKFCIIDNKLAITGSYNWTYYAETRNIENILVTEDESPVKLYNEEFEKLASRIEIASTAPRLQWSELESQNIDFDELNYEIESIAKVKHTPARKVVKATKTVEVIDIPQKAVSKYNIGLYTDRGEKPDLFIKEGDELPIVFKDIFFNYRDGRQGIRLKLMGWNESEASVHDIVLFDEPLSSIITDRNDWKLNIEIQLTFGINGYLHVTVRCVETGKAIELTYSSNQKLIDYVS